jgi:uncharacterized membrane protein
MTRERLTAFTDGVLAIIITILVLEMRPPHGASLADLAELWPVFISYVLSFIYVGIYWNNHHHMLHATRHVTGAVLWANLHLLFWLSLIPFVTGWVNENHFAAMPVALYGVVLLMSGVSYYLFGRVLIAQHAKDSPLARAMGKDLKGIISLLIYVVAIGLAFVNPWVSCALYIFVAVMWFIPDPRIERALPEALLRMS